MRHRVIGAARNAAGLAAGFGIVALVSVIMVGVILTAEENDGKLDDE